MPPAARKTQRSLLMSPTAGPGYCQEAAQQSEGMPSDFADENVYSLVSKPQNDISRGPRYRSKVRSERCVHVHLLGTLATLTEVQLLYSMLGGWTIRSYPSADGSTRSLHPKPTRPIRRYTG